MSFTIEDVRVMEQLDPEGSAGLVRELEQRQARLRQRARATFRAMEEWSTIRDEDAWVRTCDEAAEQYRSGYFLIERLGAERALDPSLMATIWGLRQGIVEDEGLESAAEMMLLDLAVLSYYNALRIQQWIGDLAIHVEHEWFGLGSPTANLGKRYGRVDGLKVEVAAKRFAEQLLPLLDRANRLVVRNLKAIRELRQPAATAAVQVNVGAQQVNVATKSANGREKHPPAGNGTAHAGKSPK
jgi:hypothetical protein